MVAQEQAVMTPAEPTCTPLPALTMPANNTWPGPMSAAVAIAGVSLGTIAAFSLYMIAVDLMNPDGDWYGLGIGLGIIFLVPICVVATILVLVARRHSWARLVFTLVMIAWTYEWQLWTFNTIDPVGSLVTYQTIGLIISVVLMWLPANKRFFEEKPAARRVYVRDY